MPTIRPRALPRSVTLLLAVAFAPVALGAQSFAQNDADAKELASYRLSMEAVNKMAAAMRFAAEEAKKNPKYQELGRLETELEALKKKEEPTEAEQARIEELSAKHDELEKEIEGPGLFNDANTLDEMEKAVRNEPLLSGALAKAGMPPREFAKFTFAMVGAAFAAGAQKAGMLKETPKGVNPDNVKFIIEHEAELQKLQEDLKGLGKEK